MRRTVPYIKMKIVIVFLNKIQKSVSIGSQYLTFLHRVPKIIKLHT